MSTTEQMALPLIDARRLYELRGAQVCCDVPLPDGTLPIMDTWRMHEDQWRQFRGMCGNAETFNRRVRELVCN